MIHPKNKVYSGIFLLSLGKLTIAVIVFNLNSEIGRILVVYYIGIVIKRTTACMTGRDKLNDFLEISVFLYMYIHLVKRYLNPFFLKSRVYLPENMVNDRMPVIIMFYPDNEFKVLRRRSIFGETY